MKKTFLLFVLLFLFTGCVNNSNPLTPTKTIDLNITKELGLENNETLVYDKFYIQPKNKSQKCLMLMEGIWIPKSKYDELEKKTKKYRKEHVSYTWDGDCANGYAQGLGKLTTYVDGIEINYEIGNVKNGVSQPIFVTKTRNHFELGSYIRDDKNRIVQIIIVLTTINNKDDIGDVFYGGLEDRKNYSDIGVRVTNTRWGKIYQIGLSKNGKYIGATKIRPKKGYNIDYYGLFDVYGNPLIVKTGSLYRNDNCGFYLYKDKKFDGYTERVCIKNKNILTEINNIIENANNANYKANEIFYLAKKLKAQYDSLHKIKEITTNKKEPKKVVDSISTGTGFIISKNGYILTNAHVIRGHSNIYAYVNKKRYKANIILVDNDNDIALLKIKGTFDYLPLNLKKAEVGEDIAVIGYPNIGLQGNEIKATFGEINSLSGVQGDIRLYQIDAPIQPGNSGSPLLNMKGEVIGIVNASLNQVRMLKETGTLAQNVNYAIKLSYALPLLYEANVKIIKPKQLRKLKKTELVKKAKKSIVLILAK